MSVRVIVVGLCGYMCIYTYRTFFLQTVAVMYNKHGYVGRYVQRALGTARVTARVIIMSYLLNCGRVIGSLNAVYRALLRNHKPGEKNVRVGGY